MNAEIQSAISGKTALSLANRCSLVFSGPDRTRYLNGQTTNDVSKLAVGHALHAAVCTNKGRMQGEIIVANTGETLHIDFPAPLLDTLPMRLEKYLIADDAEMATPEHPLQGFHFLLNDPSDLPDLPAEAQVFQSPRLGTKGLDVWLPGDAEITFAVATEESEEWIRIQHGIPHWGTDIDEKTLPPEAYPEEQTISYKKGCYIGQETIAKIKSIGRVTKKLCLLAGTVTINSLPTAIEDDGKEVGQLNSCQNTPDENGTVHALGMIQRNHSDSETDSELEIGGTAWKVIRSCN